MGSPLSPLLSNIYMEYFEKHLLSSIVDLEIIWFRYVDDVFVIILNNLSLDAFLNSLNNLSPSIKFTTEREANNCLPFLDVQVMRGNNNRPCFKVYRKPTHSNLYIHDFSGHSNNIKEGTVNNIIQRAYKVCDPQYMDEEIDFINTNLSTWNTVKKLYKELILRPDSRTISQFLKKK